jgi:hypothetical protein
MVSDGIVAVVKLVEETVAVQSAGSRERLSMTVTSPKSVEPSSPTPELRVVAASVPGAASEPRLTVVVGTVMESVPTDVIVNVTGVVAGGVQAVPTGSPGAVVQSGFCARPAVAAAAGRADAKMSPPAAATPAAVTRNSGLCM